MEVHMFGCLVLLTALALGSVPLTIDERGGVIVDARINGAGPFKFLLDTGASRSIVADDLATDLGAPVVATSEVVGSAGSDMRFVVRLDSVAVDSARVDALLAAAVPAASLSRLGRGVRGLLGQDFLSAFNYTLDYRRARLTWDEALTCDGRGAVRMIAAEGRFVMALEDHRGAPLRLVPDSGAEVPVLFRPSAALSASRAFVEGHAPAVSPGATALVTGMSGRSARAQVTAIEMLRVGSVTLRDLRAYAIERDDRHADGLLPLHAFGSVSFAAGGACIVARHR
jgi:predicted aspartyl protease